MVVFSLTLTTFAADSTQDAEYRDKIVASIDQYIQGHLVDGIYLLYDAVTNEMLRLKLAKVHKSTGRKTEDFHVACAHFTDEEGTLYDLDFLLAQKDEKFKVLQAIVHAVDEQQIRPYDLHLE